MFHDTIVVPNPFFFFLVTSVIYLLFFNSELLVITRFPRLISVCEEMLKPVDTIVCTHSENLNIGCGLFEGGGCSSVHTSLCTPLLSVDVMSADIYTRT
jgi:hypothetical protein